MSERDSRTQSTEGALDTEDAASAQPDTPSSPANGTSMIPISPKWQVVLIGGVFITINLMVMVIFVVFLFLRR